MVPEQAGGTGFQEELPGSWHSASIFLNTGFFRCSISAVHCWFYLFLERFWLLTLMTLDHGVLQTKTLMLGPNPQRFLIELKWLKSGHQYIFICSSRGFPGGSESKESACKLGDLGSVGKIPWRRGWQPTPVFLPGESPWTEEPGGLQSMQSQSRTRLSN